MTKLYSYMWSTKAMAASGPALAVTANLFTIHRQSVKLALTAEELQPQLVGFPRAEWVPVDRSQQGAKKVFRR